MTTGAGAFTVAAKDGLAAETRVALDAVDADAAGSVAPEDEVDAFGVVCSSFGFCSMGVEGREGAGVGATSFGVVPDLAEPGG